MDGCSRELTPNVEHDPIKNRNKLLSARTHCQHRHEHSSKARTSQSSRAGGEDAAVVKSSNPIAYAMATELLPVSRNAIAFLQQEHVSVLKGLHEQVDQLQRRCNELQFAVTLQLPYTSPEDFHRLVQLEKDFHEKEQECIDLNDELLLKERSERRLRADVFEKEQIILQLRCELSTKEEMIQQLRKQLDLALLQSEQRMEQLRERTPSRREPLLYERANSISSISELRKHSVVPAPPPKSTRGRGFVRPSNLYRRLLGFGARAFSQEEEPSLALPPSSRNLRNSEAASTIPQLPRLVTRGTAPNTPPRPLVRQQLRVNKLSTDSGCQTLAIDQMGLTEHRAQAAEQNRNTF